MHILTEFEHIFQDDNNQKQNLISKVYQLLINLDSKSLYLQQTWKIYCDTIFMGK